MRVSPFRRLLPVAGLVALASGAALTARTPAAAPAEKQIVVTVVDQQSGKPVPGFPKEDFMLREDNENRDIVKVEPATAPVALILFADTTSSFGAYARDMRVASQQFFKALQAAIPGSSAALWEFGGAGMPIVQMTNDFVKLDEAAGKLFPKGNTTNMESGTGVGDARIGNGVVASNLLEGLRDAGNELAKRTETRRVIVSFNSDLSAEASKLNGSVIEEAIAKAGAQWWAVSLHSGIAANGPLRDNVMGNLIPRSGGMRISITDIAALEGMLKVIPEILKSQYLITYSRPSGSPKQVQVGIKRNGVKVLAPIWAPK